MRFGRLSPGPSPRQESITAGTGERNVVAPMARKSRSDKKKDLLNKSGRAARAGRMLL